MKASINWSELMNRSPRQWSCQTTPPTTPRASYFQSYQSHSTRDLFKKKKKISGKISASPLPQVPQKLVRQMMDSLADPSA